MPVDDKSLAAYRQCSADKFPGTGFQDFRSIVDTAICTKPGGDLAGQLLYGFSLQCSNFGQTVASGGEMAVLEEKSSLRTICNLSGQIVARL
jgi:hypothetical protein